MHHRFAMIALGAMGLISAVSASTLARGDSYNADPPAAPSAAPTIGDFERAYIDANQAPELDNVVYNLGLASRDAGDADTAIVSFAYVSARGSALAPMARLRLAQVLAGAGRRSEAADVFAPVLSDDALPESLRSVARLEAATVLRHLGRHAEALALLDALGNNLQARREAADIRLTIGDPAWVNDAIAVVSLAPGSDAAAAALASLAGNSVGVPPLSAAYHYYRRHQPESARAIYTAVAVSGSATERAVAWFYLGAIMETTDPWGALDAYGASLASDPGGSLADDARWWRAIVLDQLGYPDSAVAEYDALAADFPGSSFAASALIRGAMSRAKSNPNEAGDRLRRIVASRPPTEAAAAARWLTILGLARPGDRKAADINPTSLSAILEDAAASATQPLPWGTLGEWSQSPVDWPAAEQWMAATFGPRSLEQDIRGDPGLRLAVALRRVNEEDASRSLLGPVVSTSRERPHALFDIARIASALGLHDVAMGAINQMLRPLTPAQRLQAPFTIQRLAYPTPFSDELLSAAKAEGIPPLLLAALVRQESGFNPHAGSVAGAQGLTQVIAATGEAIAGSLGRPWDPNDLFVPEHSLRYGAHYLAVQLRNFNGDVFAALAAYNAGPGNARRWLDTQRYQGADGYVDAVDFTETRTYLRTVIENYAWYRYLYGDAGRPKLR